MPAGGVRGNRQRLGPAPLSNVGTVVEVSSTGPPVKCVVGERHGRAGPYSL
jgi:hypothetical protein